MPTVNRKHRSTRVAAPQQAPVQDAAPVAKPVKAKTQTPVPRHAVPADVAHYLGKDLSVTSDERHALAQGNLLDFWMSRLGKDPVARVALSMWGTAGDLKASIEREGSQYWTPDVNIFGALGLLVRDDVPKDFSLHPQSLAELLKYWTWMGGVTKQRLVDQAVGAGVLPKTCSQVEQDVFIHRVGADLAAAHSAAVTQDLKAATWTVPGLLSRAQIADYHHQVFARHGLPPETYGGTPYRVFPNALELRWAGGLYAPDADTKG